MQLKILHVINNLGIGGAEKLLVDTLPKYRAQNVDVDVLLLNGDQTPFKTQLEKCFTGKVIVLGSKSVYHPYPIFQLMKYLRQYDILHVHLFPAMYFVSLAKWLSFSKTKLIFTEHSTSNRRVQSPIFRIIDRFIYKRYNLITAITPQVKEMLVKEVRLKNEIRVISNGIDPEKFYTASPYVRSIFFDDPHSKILIQVSRFGLEKDQMTVIRAMANLSSEFKLLLVGTGDGRQQCEDLVYKLQLTHRVKFLGVRMDVAQLLKTSDIVIQSSFWEGFGLSAVEGMAAGKPVIASDVPGLREIVFEAGLLFEAGNESSLIEQIKHVIQDPIYYAEIAEKCRIRAKNFGIDTMVDQFIKVYETLK
ncbi:glycosyltransferase [Pedobacter antarcticus]|uniref:glycosyltransferase n=1 Tax=Pedobacter antarcticus TaxID=34086 RepID=UPI000882A858|nr:glycosyltransferase [Pedobacter antarcticus]SDM17586.1 Glycosyltransferase involved in cell wall bisynthesis [Pedobacter antarcticus]